MDSHDETRLEREPDGDFETVLDEHETHATTGGAAAAGAVTGGVIGLAGGPLGAAIGAVGGAIIGAASERLMHSDDDRERARAGYADEDATLHDDMPLRENASERDDMPLRENATLRDDTTLHDDMPLRENATLRDDTTLHDDIPLRENADMVTEASPVGRQSADTPSDVHASTERYVTGTPRPAHEVPPVSSSSRREHPNGADQLPGTDPLRNDPLR